jgi:hypothetical protein
MSLKSQLVDHERFGELSALAALGQVTPKEYLELKEHLGWCAACRAEYATLADLQLKQLPLAHTDAPLSIVHPRLTGASNPRSRQRSFADAPNGVQPYPRTRLGWFREKMEWRGLRPVHAHAAIVGLLILAGGLGFRLFNSANADRARLEQVARLNDEVVRLHDQVQNLSSRITSRSSGSPNSPSSASTEASRPPGDYPNLLVRNRDLELRLKTATDEVESLRNQINSGARREADLSVRLSETQDTLARIGNEMQALRDVHTQDSLTIHGQQDRLSQIEATLSATTDSIDRDKKLLMADRDIRDLMGARNLRIVDVFDVDGKGRTRKPFGRAFFTEGKSLIFYAFDLERNQTAAQAASYQAWGYEGSYQHGVRSLGIFYQDDHKANRWVLKFDNPDVLAEIDSVFVTIEPPGGSNKPTGNKLLAAYLKASLNHP